MLFFGEGRGEGQGSTWKGFSVVLVVKNPPANAGDIGDLSWIPGLGRSPGEGNGWPFQYSCLENPMNRGAWRATAHGVAKSRARLKRLGTHKTCTWKSTFLLMFSRKIYFRKKERCQWTCCSGEGSCPSQDILCSGTFIPGDRVAAAPRAPCSGRGGLSLLSREGKWQLSGREILGKSFHLLGPWFSGESTGLL